MAHYLNGNGSPIKVHTYVSSKNQGKPKWHGYLGTGGRGGIVTYNVLPPGARFAREDRNPGIVYRPNPMMIGWREDLGWRNTCRENLPPPF